MWQQHKMPCSYQHSHFCCVMAMIDPAGGSVPNGPSLHHPGVFPVHGTKHGQGDDGHASNSTHQHHHGCRCRPDKCVPIASRNINSLSCIPAARQQHDMSVLVFFSLVVCGKGGVALLLNRMNPMSREAFFLIILVSSIMARCMSDWLQSTHSISKWHMGPANQRDVKH